MCIQQTSGTSWQIILQTAVIKTNMFSLKSWWSVKISFVLENKIKLFYSRLVLP